MRTKEIVQLIAALVVLAVAGYMIYLQFTPKKAAGSQAATYEVVTPISPDYDAEALRKLTDFNRAKDFYSKPDLKSGLGNSQVFGPLQ